MGSVPPGDGEAETQLLNWSWLSAPPGPEDGRPWDERVPPPDGDATLLAVVPIPGTGTSVAIVGYVIAAPAAAGPHARAVAARGAATAPGTAHAAHAAQTAPADAAPADAAPADAAPADAAAAGRAARGRRPAGSGLRLDHPQRRVWVD